MTKQKHEITVEKLQKEVEECKNKYLRALADYQNLEKRISASRSEDIRFATKNVIVKLLPILDTLYKIRVFVNNQGLELAVKQFEEILAGEKVERLTVTGKQFDPAIMECIEVIPGGKDNIITEEVQTGYTMHGQLLRVARVKVGKEMENVNSKIQDEQKDKNVE